MLNDVWRGGVGQLWGLGCCGFGGKGKMGNWGVVICGRGFWRARGGACAWGLGGFLSVSFSGGVLAWVFMNCR